MNSIIEAKNPTGIDIVYLDIRKAFDTVLTMNYCTNCDHLESVAAYGCGSGPIYRVDLSLFA